MDLMLPPDEPAIRIWRSEILIYRNRRRRNGVRHARDCILHRQGVPELLSQQIYEQTLREIIDAAIHPEVVEDAIKVNADAGPHHAPPGACDVIRYSQPGSEIVAVRMKQLRGLNFTARDPLCHRAAGTQHKIKIYCIVPR